MALSGCRGLLVFCVSLWQPRSGTFRNVIQNSIFFHSLVRCYTAKSTKNRLWHVVAFWFPSLCGISNCTPWPLRCSWSLNRNLEAFTAGLDDVLLWDRFQGLITQYLSPAAAGFITKGQVSPPEILDTIAMSSVTAFSRAASIPLRFIAAARDMTDVCAQLTCIGQEQRQMRRHQLPGTWRPNLRISDKFFFSHDVMKRHG